MKALILCAGRGTRLGLKKTPKCMVKVNKKPVLEHLVNHLNKHGITEIIVNISDHADYTKIFRYFGTRLLYFYEPHLLGEYATQRMLQPWLGDRYIVMNGDTLTNVDITKMVNNGNTVVFVKGTKYAGTQYINTEESDSRISVVLADYGDAYYFDIGTKKGLAQARRYYAKHS